MAKHKEKKSKKHKKDKKHKKNKKKYCSSTSGDESSGQDEILWCDENETNEKNTKQETQSNKIESNNVNRDNVDDWLGFFERTTSENSKQGAVDRQKRKDDLARAENKMRYSRELNPYFKDDKKGEYIEDPEEFYKKNDKQEKEYSSSGSDHGDDDDDDVNDESESESGNQSKKPLTDAEKNALNAKLIKAEMLGDDDLVREIKAKLTNSSACQTKVEVYEKKMKKKDLTKSEEQMSVREMYFQTKSMSARDEMMRFVSSSSKLKRADDEYDVVKSKKKKQKVQNSTYERQRNDNDSRCRQCAEEMEKHLVLKFQREFQSCFVALSSKETFVPNVVQIQSRDHSFRCSLEADEDCWREIREIMRNMSTFFEKFYDQKVIFMETHFRNEKASQNISRKHFVIECIPIKRQYEDDARIYFHKAIMECEEEWTQNKKMIKLDEKSITTKLPKGLPYFWVSFGPNFNGFAHVIEDEHHFSTKFGTEIISGLLDIDCSKWNKSKRYQSNTSNGRLLKNWREFNSA